MGAKGSTDVDKTLFGAIQKREEINVRWYQYVTHAGYYTIHSVVCCFRHPLKKEHRDLELLEQVRTMLELKVDDESIKKSRMLVGLHRVVENTHARRRLERWSLWVIAIYLLVVLGILFGCYADMPGVGLPFMKIPEKIMIAILSTTTANIIGLGLIVLRGHFLANEDNREQKKAKEDAN